MKTSAYVATSLDGFIARENGDIDWLPPPGGEGEDYGYARFMDTVDVLVIGRSTYQAALAFHPWPYGRKRVVALSTSAITIPEEAMGSVEAMACPPSEVVRRLSDRGFRHAYVDGGRTIQGFLDAGLIHQLIITRVPVLIGRGIPLFGPTTRDIRLQHIETRAFANGLVQGRYEVVGVASAAPVGRT